MKRSLVIGVATLLLLSAGACSSGPSTEERAKSAALDFAHSREAHDGAYCALLTGKTEAQIKSCETDEADLKEKALTNPQPPMNPTISDVMEHEKNFGISLEVTQSNAKQYVAVELVPNGDSFLIGNWNYVDEADYGTPAAITKTLGW